jgi:serine/threonine protein kinase
MNQELDTRIEVAESESSAVEGRSKYRVIAELGRGGMALVYLAVSQGLGGFNKLQVLKHLRPALADDPELLQMFLEEARLSARINHPNVVQTNEVGFDGKHHYIAMEFLDGQSLEAIWRKVAKTTQAMVPLELHLRILIETLGGLHAAHELTDFDGQPLNVVHRDVSPHNVIVTYDGQVKVLDFGIAKAADSANHTRTGILKGKSAYMAPEQFGGRDLDRRVDIFAVGIMLWQALTGERLWRGMGDAEIFRRVALGDIRVPSSVRRVDPQLEAICMKALAPIPSDRYATAAEFQAALDEALRALPERRGARELGAFVRELFEETRRDLARRIDVAIKKYAAEGHPSSNTPYPLGPVGASLPPRSATLVNVATEVEQRAPPPSRRRGIVIAVLTGMVVLGVGVALKIRSSIASSTTPPPIASAAPVASTMPVPGPSSGSPSPSIQVSVRAVPAEAKLSLDDTALSGNPASAAFPRDGLAHRVRAEAPGFKPKTETVTFDQAAIQVPLTLEKAAPVAVAPPRGHAAAAKPRASASQTQAAAEPPPPPKATATESEAVPRPQRRPIDFDNPFPK